MLKRLIALTGILAALAGTVAVTPAFATGPTCDTHSVPAPIIGNDNQVGESWDFQCGGAIGRPNADFQVTVSIDYEYGGVWHLAACNGGGGYCTKTWPTGTTSCGSYYCAGTEHTGSNVFTDLNFNNSCNAQGWRQQVTINFRNTSYSPLTYTSNTVSC